jgi:hypothetical protein
MALEVEEAHTYWDEPLSHILFGLSFRVGPLSIIDGAAGTAVPRSPALVLVAHSHHCLSRSHLLESLPLTARGRGARAGATFSVGGAK